MQTEMLAEMLALSANPSACHPERSTAASEASRCAQSKDPFHFSRTRGSLRNSHENV